MNKPPSAHASMQAPYIEEEHATLVAVVLSRKDFHSPGMEIAPEIISRSPVIAGMWGLRSAEETWHIEVVLWSLAEQKLGAAMCWLPGQC